MSHFPTIYYLGTYKWHLTHAPTAQAVKSSWNSWQWSPNVSLQNTASPGLSFQYRKWRPLGNHKIKFIIYITLANFAFLFLIFIVSSTTKQKVEIEMEKMWYKIMDNSMACRAKISLSPGKRNCVQVWWNVKQ